MITITLQRARLGVHLLAISLLSVAVARSDVLAQEARPGDAATDVTAPVTLTSADVAPREESGDSELTQAEVEMTTRFGPL